MRLQASGFFDLQVNGFAGVDFNDPATTPEAVARALDAQELTGVTRCLPTLITSSLEDFARCARTVLATGHAAVAGLHVEGPYLAPEDGPRGAHPREHVRAPDLDEVAEWQRVSGGLVGKITLSPHHDQVSGFIRAVVGQGILVAIGHTSATAEQIHAAVAAGARLSTHLGNGAAAILPRHPNFIWAQLADDRLDAGFIADGFHLPADTLKAMLRAKG